MRRSTPPPPKTSAAAQAGSAKGSSVASKPFASTGPSERGAAAAVRRPPSSQGSRASPRPTPAAHSPSPRGRSMSTAKYLASKNANASNNGGLSAYALAQVKDQGMSMSQRVDQIMKIPKVDARPEMYRIDIGMEEDLRTLHDQQSKRDPELQAAPLARIRPDKNQTTYDFLDVAGEVISVGDSSNGGGRAANSKPTGPTQKKHVPPLNTSKITGVSEKKHIATGGSSAAPWERSPGRKVEGRLQSPTSNNVSNHHDFIGASPIQGRTEGPRSQSARSDGSASLYEFAPSLVQLKSAGVLAREKGVSPREVMAVAPLRAATDARVSPRRVDPAQGLSLNATDAISLPPAYGNVDRSRLSAGTPNRTRAESPLQSPRTKSVVVREHATVAPPTPTRRSPTPNTTAAAPAEEPLIYPTTRGASQTATYRYGLRQQVTIKEFERHQPQNELPPRPRRTTPRGVLVDFSHDSHFTSFSESDNTRSVAGIRAPPRIITVGKVSAPSRPLIGLRSVSPAAVGDPNVLAPTNPPPKRLARSVTPPGGRRGSSGIFDVSTVAASAAAIAKLMPKKSMANMDRLLVNTQTSMENTLISPSMEGKTELQHSAATASPLRRTMSSLQTHNLVTKVADSLKAAVPQNHQPVSRRMMIRSPQALRLQSSTQVSLNMCWE